ncbi:hypothetical protein Mapa_009389 [Marchantia paleacea]|nr:hypothetical protein Mapa_009389 [Marchantia paleacea]
MTEEGNPSETSSSSAQEDQGSPQIMATNEQTSKMSENKVGVTKWRGGIQMVINCSIERAWETSSEFCGLHKWVDTTDTCECIEGEPQVPGCVRVMTGNSFPRADGSKSFAKEKLLTFDNENRSMSYLMMENNFGLSDYIATFKMQDLGGGAVLVDWSFEVNPIPHSTEQKTADYMTGVYKETLKKLEALINSQTSSHTTHVSPECGDSLKAPSNETLKGEKLEEGKQV